MKKIKDRILKTFLNLFKLSFLSWIAIFIAELNVHNFNGFSYQFYFFTASVIGLKLFFEKNKNGGEN